VCAIFDANTGVYCVPNGVTLDMLAQGNNGFFGFQDDFATLPVGARVGAMREVNLRYSCHNDGMFDGSETRGTGMIAASGVFLDAATNTYTTVQLNALGLGYRIWWHEPVYPQNVNYFPKHNVIPHSNSDPTQNAFPDNWYPFWLVATGTDHYVIPVRVIFFKINNNFLNTNGANLPANVSANLFNFYIAAPDAPTTPLGPIYSYTLQLNYFSSKQRICTPLVNQNIELIDMITDELPSAGTVNASLKSFSLNFNCPYMAYYTVGFKLEGIDGVLDANNGVFGIKQGAGYAQGVGIQIWAKDLATSWRNDQNYVSPYQALKPDTDYFIPWFEYITADAAITDPATAMRSRMVDFMAAYYRMPGAPLTGGQVESRIVLRFVYQ